MPVAPRDLLTFANALLAGAGEVELRGAVSRAYYAAYHATLPIASTLPATRTDGGVHVQQVARLKQCPKNERCATQIKMLGRLLEQERLNRKLADYDLDRAVTITVATDSAAVSKRVVDLAEWVRERREQVKTGK